MSQDPDLKPIVVVCKRPGCGQQLARNAAGWWVHSHPVPEGFEHDPDPVPA